jgi:hypothetical protein
MQLFCRMRVAQAPTRCGDAFTQQLDAGIRSATRTAPELDLE